MKPPSTHQLPSSPTNLISGLVALRQELALDHDDMADRMDAPKFEIVDFERNLGDPSISFLTRYVRALGMRLNVTLVPESTQARERPRGPLHPTSEEGPE